MRRSRKKTPFLGPNSSTLKIAPTTLDLINCLFELISRICQPVFFFHNKSSNNTFYHSLSAKRTSLRQPKCDIEDAFQPCLVERLWGSDSTQVPKINQTPRTLPTPSGSGQEQTKQTHAASKEINIAWQTTIARKWNTSIKVKYHVFSTPST